MSRLSSKSTVPILVHDERRIQGSIAIYDYIDTCLAPGSLSRASGDDDAARDLEAQIDETLGVSGRRIAYSGQQSDTAGIARLWCQAGPVWAKAFYWLMFPFVMSKVQRMYQSDHLEAVRHAFAEVDRAIDRSDELLRHRPYLAGDVPGRVDFAVASLLAPLNFPREHPAPWSYVPPTLQALGQKYATRPTLRHVEKMYRKHRHAGAPYHLGRGGARLRPHFADSLVVAGRTPV
jgi:glutathione S-transferase